MNKTGTRLGVATERRRSHPRRRHGRDARHAAADRRLPDQLRVQQRRIADGRRLCAYGAVWLFDAATGERVGSDLRVPFSSAPDRSRLHARRHDAPRRQAQAARSPCSTSSGARSWPVRPSEPPAGSPRSRRTAPGSPSRSMVPTTTRQSSTWRPASFCRLCTRPDGSRIGTRRPARFVVAFSPDGQEVAIGSAAYDGQPAEIEVFSVADGTSLRRLPVPGVPFIGEPLAWSPDGRVLAGGLHDRVVRIDAMTGARLSGPCPPRPPLCARTAIRQGRKAGGRRRSDSGFGKAWVFDASGQPIRTYGSTTDPYLHSRLGTRRDLILPNVAIGEIRLVEPVADRQAGPSFAGPTGSA